MTHFKNIFFLICLVFISSCGYHLRGGTDLTDELKAVYMEGGSNDLRNIFKKTLKSSKGDLVSSIEEAGIVIQIVNEEIDRHPLSLNERGRVNEYELNYSLSFVLLDTNGKQLSEKQKIEINRDYFNNQDDLLGKNNEEKVIRKEMYRQATQSILRRAKAVQKKDNTL